MTHQDHPSTDHNHDHDHDSHAAPDTSHWDAVYGEAEQVWSGEPNHTLVTEVAGMSPGRVLDVGCGEGADAVWLASRGWQVTALDPSGVALDRARAAASARGVDITWLHAGLADAPPETLPDSGFDLVVSFYGVLSRDTGPVERLARLVAPGGTLLVVHHVFDAEHGHDHDHGQDERDQRHGIPADLLMTPEDVAAGLGAGWSVLTHEQRDRHVTRGAGAGHTADIVVRAIRS